MTGSLFDWSSTASSNTTCESINTNTGMAVTNTDNVFRAIMAVIRNSFSSSLQNFLKGAAALPVASGGTAGTTPSEARTALGLDALVVPTGSVFAFAKNTAPAGYLECSGAAVSRTTYSALFAVIGTTFGSGDGSTTFNLPQLRGEFVRGWDNGRGVDSGRSFGSAQADQLEAHTHTIPKSNTGGGDGAQNGPASLGTITTSSTGGTETRPRNIALLYCIKI